MEKILLPLFNTSQNEKLQLIILEWGFSRHRVYLPCLCITFQWSLPHPFPSLIAAVINSTYECKKTCEKGYQKAKNHKCLCEEVTTVNGTRAVYWRLSSVCIWARVRPADRCSVCETAGWKRSWFPGCGAVSSGGAETFQAACGQSDTNVSSLGSCDVGSSCRCRFSFPGAVGHTSLSFVCCCRNP